MIGKDLLGSIGGMALCVACTALLSYNIGKKVRAERDEYKRSVYALLDKVDSQRLDSTRMAYTISQITLERDEFKSRNEEDANTIKELNAKLRDVQSVYKTEIIAETTIKVPFNSQLLDAEPIQLFDVDKYKSVGLTITKDSIVGSVRIDANLTQYIYADYKHHFLWWRWGLRGIRQTIVCDNPNVKIGYAEYYSLK